MNETSADNQVVTQTQVEQALLRLESATDSPRALTIRPDQQSTIHQAIDRVHAQLLGQADAVLTIALAGCTGAGKSTLINALAGSAIAESSDRRPCTMQTRVYHHRDVPAGGLPQDLAQQAGFVAHDRPELRHKVIVDTPDLDTFYTANRAATQALLKAAGLVIYVFSPERYVEERAWSVIREEHRFSSCLAVINKADTVPTDVLAKIANEIRQRFTDMGKSDIRVLSINAAAHVPGPDGRLPAAPADAADEFITLRAHIEHELQAGDLARMIRQQRSRVIENLQAQVEGILPVNAHAKVETLQATATGLTHETAQSLAEQMHEPLMAVEADLAPLVAMRKHQRFWGPFRTWLSIADFLRYGLPRLVRQLRVFSSEGTTLAGRTLADQADRVGDAVRKESRDLQDYCFQNGLPVERWQAVTSDIDGRQILGEITRRIESRFESLAAKAFRQNTALIWLVSFIAWVLPVALVVFAFLNLAKQFIGGPLAGLFGQDHPIGRFFAGAPVGSSVLWDFVTLIILSYLLLHMLTGAVLSSRSLFARSSIARQSLDETLTRIVEKWTTIYASDLEADIADFQEPLAVLQRAADGTIVRPNQWTSKPLPEADSPAATFASTPGTPGTPHNSPSPARSDEPQISPAELLRRSMQPKTKS